jgi:hypothetical protein
MAELTPWSATMMSTYFANAGITQGIVENRWSRELKTLYRENPLCRAQGPCGRLQNKTVHDGVRKYGCINRIQEVYSYRHHISSGPSIARILVVSLPASLRLVNMKKWARNLRINLPRLTRFSSGPTNSIIFCVGLVLKTRKGLMARG